MKFNTANFEGLTLFKQEVKRIIDKGATADLNEDLGNATWTQSKARWLYLDMVASDLNDRGEEYNVTEKLCCRFTKELLYAVYWQSLRETMFPNKKKLTTKEFCELTDMMLIMMARLYSVTIPFPNKENVPYKI